MALASCGDSVSSIPPQFHGNWITKGQKLGGDSVPLSVGPNRMGWYEGGADVRSVSVKTETQIVVDAMISREDQQTRESQRLTLLNGGKHLLIDENAVKVETPISKNVFTYEYVSTNEPPRRLVRYHGNVTQF